MLRHCCKKAANSTAAAAVSATSPRPFPSHAGKHVSEKISKDSQADNIPAATAAAAGASKASECVAGRMSCLAGPAAAVSFLLAEKSRNSSSAYGQPTTAAARESRYIAADPPAFLFAPRTRRDKYENPRRPKQRVKTPPFYQQPGKLALTSSLDRLQHQCQTVPEQRQQHIRHQQLLQQQDYQQQKHEQQNIPDRCQELQLPYGYTSVGQLHGRWVRLALHRLSRGRQRLVERARRQQLSIQLQEQRVHQYQQLLQQQQQLTRQQFGMEPQQSQQQLQNTTALDRPPLTALKPQATPLQEYFLGDHRDTRVHLSISPDEDDAPPSVTSDLTVANIETSMRCNSGSSEAVTDHWSCLPHLSPAVSGQRGSLSSSLTPLSNKCGANPSDWTSCLSEQQRNRHLLLSERQQSQQDCQQQRQSHQLSHKETRCTTESIVVPRGNSPGENLVQEGQSQAVLPLLLSSPQQGQRSQKQSKQQQQWPARKLSCKEYPSQQQQRAPQVQALPKLRLQQGEENVDKSVEDAIPVEAAASGGESSGSRYGFVCPLYATKKDKEQVPPRALLTAAAATATPGLAPTDTALRSHEEGTRRIRASKTNGASESRSSVSTVPGSTVSAENADFDERGDLANGRRGPTKIPTQLGSASCDGDDGLQSNGGIRERRCTRGMQNTHVDNSASDCGSSESERGAEMTPAAGATDAHAVAICMSEGGMAKPCQLDNAFFEAKQSITGATGLVNSVVVGQHWRYKMLAEESAAFREMYVHPPKWRRLLGSLEKLLPVMAAHDLCLSLKYLLSCGLVVLPTTVQCIYMLQQRVEELSARELALVAFLLNSRAIRGIRGCPRSTNITYGSSSWQQQYCSSRAPPSDISPAITPHSQAAVENTHTTTWFDSPAASNVDTTVGATAALSAPDIAPLAAAVGKSVQKKADDITIIKTSFTEAGSLDMLKFSLLTEKRVLLRRVSACIAVRLQEIDNADDLSNLLWSLHANGILSAQLLQQCRRLLLHRLGALLDRPAPAAASSPSPASSLSNAQSKRSLQYNSSKPGFFPQQGPHSSRSHSISRKRSSEVDWIFYSTAMTTTQEQETNFFKTFKPRHAASLATLYLHAKPAAGLLDDLLLHVLMNAAAALQEQEERQLLISPSPKLSKNSRGSLLASNQCSHASERSPLPPKPHAPSWGVRDAAATAQRQFTAAGDAAADSGGIKRHGALEAASATGTEQSAAATTSLKTAETPAAESFFGVVQSTLHRSNAHAHNPAKSRKDVTCKTNSVSVTSSSTSSSTSSNGSSRGGSSSAEGISRGKNDARHREWLLFSTHRSTGKDLVRCSEALAAVACGPAAAFHPQAPPQKYSHWQDEINRQQMISEEAVLLAALRKRRLLTPEQLSAVLFHACCCWRTSREAPQARATPFTEATLTGEEGRISAAAYGQDMGLDATADQNAVAAEATDRQQRMDAACKSLLFFATRRLAWEPASFSVAAKLQLLMAAARCSPGLMPDPVFLAAVAASLTAAFVSMNFPAGQAANVALPLLSFGWVTLATLLTVTSNSEAARTVDVLQHQYQQHVNSLHAAAATAAAPGLPLVASLSMAPQVPTPSLGADLYAAAAGSRETRSTKSSTSDTNISERMSGTSTAAENDSNSHYSRGGLTMSYDLNDWKIMDNDSLVKASSVLDFGVDLPPIPEAYMLEKKALQQLLALRDAMEAATLRFLVARSSNTSGTSKEASSQRSATSGRGLLNQVGPSDTATLSVSLLSEMALLTQLAAAAVCVDADPAPVKLALQLLKHRLSAASSLQQPWGPPVEELKSTVAAAARNAATAVLTADMQAAALTHSSNSPAAARLWEPVGVRRRLVCLAEIFLHLSSLRWREAALLYPLVEVVDAAALAASSVAAETPCVFPANVTDDDAGSSPSTVAALISGAAPSPPQRLNARPGVPILSAPREFTAFAAAENLLLQRSVVQRRSAAAEGTEDLLSSFFASVYLSLAELQALDLLAESSRRFIVAWLLERLPQLQMPSLLLLTQAAILCCAADALNGPQICFSSRTATGTSHEEPKAGAAIARGFKNCRPTCDTVLSHRQPSKQRGAEGAGASSLACVGNLMLWEVVTEAAARYEKGFYVPSLSHIPVWMLAAHLLQGQQQRPQRGKVQQLGHQQHQENMPFKQEKQMCAYLRRFQKHLEWRQAAAAADHIVLDNRPPSAEALRMAASAASPGAAKRPPAPATPELQRVLQRTEKAAAGFFRRWEADGQSAGWLPLQTLPPCLCFRRGLRFRAARGVSLLLQKQTGDVTIAHL